MNGFLDSVPRGVRRDRLPGHRGVGQEAAHSRKAEGVPEPQLRRGGLLPGGQAPGHGRRRRGHRLMRVPVWQEWLPLDTCKIVNDEAAEMCKRPTAGSTPTPRPAVGRQGQPLRARALRQGTGHGRCPGGLPLRPALSGRRGLQAVLQGAERDEHPRRRAPHAAAGLLAGHLRVDQPAPGVRPHHGPGDRRGPRAVQRHVRGVPQPQVHPHHVRRQLVRSAEAPHAQDRA